MKKVLLVTNPHCGGAERITILFGKLLHKKGYEVEVLICKQGSEEECELIPFIPEDFCISYTTGRYRTLFFRLYSFLKRNPADYVFSSLPLINHLLIPLVKLFFRNKRIIVRECNTPSRHPEAIVKKNRILLRYADAIISQTDEMAKEMTDLYGLISDSITTIVNPVDEELINGKIAVPYGFPEGRKIYVAVGRVQPQKDYETLIRAFAKVQEFSFANIDEFSTGSLVARITNDVTQVQNFVNMLLRMALRSPGMMIGGIIMAVIFLFLYKKYWKQILILFACVLGLFQIWQGPVFKAIGIEKQSFAEAASVPLQQIGYVL